jgi:uncharacterized protein (TIGR03382 family)
MGPSPSFRILGAAAVVWLVLTSVAQGYSYQLTEAGTPKHWRRDAVPLVLGSRLVEVFGEAPAFQGATMAAEAWRGFPRVPALEIAAGGPSDATPLGAPDGENTIEVISPWPHGPAQLAVTVLYSRASGEIIEADVLLNGDMPMALLSEAPPGRAVGQAVLDRHDVASVLTHELGHVLGLGESEHAGATMWPAGQRGETFRRSLSDDDEQGVIALYESVAAASAAGHDPGPEPRALMAGCAASGGPVTGAPAAWAVGLAVLWLRRRAVARAAGFRRLGSRAGCFRGNSPSSGAVPRTVRAS